MYSFKRYNTKSCADAFVLNWVSRFDCPSILSCDRGGQFSSHLWEELCNFLGCKLIHTTSFHPQSNGLIERQHRILKAALKAQNNYRDWYRNLGFVLLGIRSSPKVDTGVSSSQMTLGTSLRLPGQFFTLPNEEPQMEYCQRLTEYMSALRAPPPQHHGERAAYLEKALCNCTHVL